MNVGEKQYFYHNGWAQGIEIEHSGLYKLECIGALGQYVRWNTGVGSSARLYDNYAQYAGYSCGYAILRAGDFVFACVGGYDGYNGGGIDQTGTQRSGGGGATHFAFRNGTLEQIGEANKNSVLIVAGGSGGLAQSDSGTNTFVNLFPAARGGGLTAGMTREISPGVDLNIYAGKQTSGGVSAFPGEQTGSGRYTGENGRFGKGGNGFTSAVYISSVKRSYTPGCGGGGWYGGACGTVGTSSVTHYTETSITMGNVSSGGGGSGYIGGTPAVTYRGQTYYPESRCGVVDTSPFPLGTAGGNGLAIITFVADGAPSTISTDTPTIKIFNNDDIPFHCYLSNDKPSTFHHSVWFDMLDGYTTLGYAEFDPGKNDFDIQLDQGGISFVTNGDTRSFPIYVETWELDGGGGKIVVGRESTWVTIQVSESVVPSIRSDDYNFYVEEGGTDVPAGWGIFVQHHSDIVFKSCVLEAYGATITLCELRYYFVADDGTASVSYSQFTAPDLPSGPMTPEYTNTTFRINSVPRGGTLKATLFVTDTRNHVAIANYPDIRVEPYSAPVFGLGGLSVVRASADGEADDLGESMLITCPIGFSYYGEGKNVLTIAVEYRERSKIGEAIWNQLGTLTLDVASRIATGHFGNDELSTDASYDVRLTATDQYSTVQTELILYAVRFAIHFKDGGDGAAFGMPSRKANTIEIHEDWDIEKNGVRLFEKLQQICDALGISLQ